MMFMKAILTGFFIQMMHANGIKRLGGFNTFNTTI